VANSQTPSDIARETLKLLATRRLQPTPENYQRLFHEIAGTRPSVDDDTGARLAELLRGPAAAYPAVSQLGVMATALADRDWSAFGAALDSLAAARSGSSRADWPALIRELVRQLESRQTGATLARKREGLERLLTNFGTDPALPDKLQALLRAWVEIPEQPGASVEVASEPARHGGASSGETIRQARELLAHTIEAGVAARLERFPELTIEAKGLAQQARDARDAEAWTRLGAQLKQFWYRVEVRSERDEDLLGALLRVLGLMVNNIGELVEDDQWVSGQLTMIKDIINQPLNSERVRQAERSLKEVIYKQSMLKQSLRDAKATLKHLIGAFVNQLSEMSASTAGYQTRVGSYAERLQSADSLPALKSIVDELMGDTRTMQVDMQRYRDDIVAARKEADLAEQRVRELEVELQQVSEQVREDQLTGTLNRRGLEDAMERELSRAQRRKTPLCVAILDLDNFKKLNDTYGHQAGDDALVHLSKVVTGTLRPTDIVARYGGEEFLILFSDTTLQQAVEAMRRLQRELTKRFFLHNNERLLITFSAGVATLRPSETQESLFARADKAMYQAKLQGKNRVVAADA
jgi:diguanylate cyclase